MFIRYASHWKGSLEHDKIWIHWAVNAGWVFAASGNCRQVCSCSNVWSSEQVYPHDVSGHPESTAEGTEAALLLGDDVRVCWRQHAPAAGDLSGECPPTGATTVYNDPEEPGRDAAVWVWTVR